MSRPLERGHLAAPPFLQLLKDGGSLVKRDGGHLQHIGEALFDGGVGLAQGLGCASGCESVGSLVGVFVQVVSIQLLEVRGGRDRGKLRVENLLDLGIQGFGR